MKRLGRIIALPLLILSMALQGLAPAQGDAMPRDAFGQPICSARDLADGGSSHKQGPMQGHEHDCCVAACAAAGLVAAPPNPTALPLPPVAQRIVQRLPGATLGPRGPPARIPNARGPPTQP